MDSFALECFDMFIADMKFDKEKDKYLIDLDPFSCTDTKEADDKESLRRQLEEVPETDWLYFISKARLEEYFLNSVLRFYQ